MPRPHHELTKLERGADNPVLISPWSGGDIEEHSNLSGFYTDVFLKYPAHQGEGRVGAAFSECRFSLLFPRSLTSDYQYAQPMLLSTPER